MIKRERDIWTTESNVNNARCDSDYIYSTNIM